MFDKHPIDPPPSDPSTSDPTNADSGSDERKPDLRNALYVPSHASSIDLTDILGETFWDEFEAAGLELAERAEERTVAGRSRDESTVNQLRTRVTDAIQSLTERLRGDSEEDVEPVDQLEEALDALEPRGEASPHRAGGSTDQSTDPEAQPQASTTDDS